MNHDPKLKNLLAALVSVLFIFGLISFAGATSVRCYDGENKEVNIRSYCHGYTEADCAATAICKEAVLEASQTCGDQNVQCPACPSCPLTKCPDVVVEGSENIGQCAKCSVRVFANGTTKTKCNRCTVRYTSEPRPY